MYQFYVFSKQKNAKISLITIKLKLELKVIKENRINLYLGIDLRQYRNPASEEVVRDWNP